MISHVAKRIRAREIADVDQAERELDRALGELENRARHGRRTDRLKVRIDQLRRQAIRLYRSARG